MRDLASYTSGWGSNISITEIDGQIEVLIKHAPTSMSIRMPPVEFAKLIERVCQTMERMSQ